MRAIGNQLIDFHGVSRMLSRTPTPLLMQDGWTDDLFSPGQALRVYNALRARRPGAAANVALQFGDLGHARGSAGNDRINQQRYFNDQALRFFDFWLRRRGRRARARERGDVHADLPGHPQRAAARSRPRAGPPCTRARCASAAPRRARSRRPAANPATGDRVQPELRHEQQLHDGAERDRAGHRRLPARRRRGPYTLIGRPTVRATVRTTGPFGQLESRLWDVAPNGLQTLVGRGEYRLTPNQRGTVLFQLRGSGWRFERGHTAKLELLGNDDPYLRASNGTFSVAVSRLTVELPVRERPGTVPGVGAPVLAPPLAPFGARRRGRPSAADSAARAAIARRGLIPAA